MARLPRILALLLHGERRTRPRSSEIEHVERRQRDVIHDLARLTGSTADEIRLEAMRAQHRLGR